MEVETLRQVFLLLDWIMELPPELATSFKEELYRFEESIEMPCLPSQSSRPFCQLLSRRTWILVFFVAA